ncbi:MAG: hypothetical protein ACYDEX_00675 [Mobilitalea sp.]
MMNEGMETQMFEPWEYAKKYRLQENINGYDLTFCINNCYFYAEEVVSGKSGMASNYPSGYNIFIISEKNYIAKAKRVDCIEARLFMDTNIKFKEDGWYQNIFDTYEKFKMELIKQNYLHKPQYHYNGEAEDQLLVSLEHISEGTKKQTNEIVKPPRGSILVTKEDKDIFIDKTHYQDRSSFHGWNIIFSNEERKVNEIPTGSELTDEHVKQAISFGEAYYKGYSIILGADGHDWVYHVKIRGTRYWEFGEAGLDFINAKNLILATMSYIDTI